MKIGFAITAYDKFEEAKILIEIIRNEFKGDYKISFCSNHPEGEAFAKKEKLDSYIQGRNIPYFGGDIHRPDNVKNRISIVLRSTDTVQRSCENAMQMDVDYIIHMHSDAWVLNEGKLLELVNSLNKSKKKIALRGAGLERFYADTPVGHMDDHFFVFEKKFCLENKVFQFKPEHFFPHIFTVHGILFVNILAKVGLDKIWYYADTKTLLNYDGKVLGMRTVKPVSFDPNYDFLHIHRGSFPGDYGKNIQAMYLKRYGITKSKFISDFINENYIDEVRLLDELGQIENKLNKKLRAYKFPTEIINNREIKYKEELCNKTSISILFKNLTINIMKNIYYRLRPLQNIENLPDYYKNVVELSNFVEDDWIENIYSKS